MIVGPVRRQIYNAASDARSSMAKLTKEAAETLNEVEKAAKLMQAATLDMKAALLEVFAEILSGIEEVNDGFDVEVTIPHVATQMAKLPVGGDINAVVRFKLRESDD